MNKKIAVVDLYSCLPYIINYPFVEVSVIIDGYDAQSYPPTMCVCVCIHFSNIRKSYFLLSSRRQTGPHCLLSTLQVQHKCNVYPQNNQNSVNGKRSVILSHRDRVNIFRAVSSVRLSYLCLPLNLLYLSTRYKYKLCTL